MKKILSLFAAVLFAGSMMAEPVTITPTNSGWTTTQGAQTGTAVDGVTASCNNGATGTTQAEGATLRIYKDATLTISVASGNITTIVFTCVASGTTKYGPGCFGAQTGYSYNNMKGTWTGSATSVAFTASSNQVRATQIEVYLNGEEPPVDTWVADTINVAQARALINNSDAHDHYVVGIVADQPFNTFNSFSGRVSFNLVDDLSSTDSLQAYQILDKENAQWTSLEAAQQELRVGDTIMVYAGALKLYAAKNIYEIDPGYYVEKLGANPNPPALVGPDTISVDSALVLAKALTPATGSSQSTSKEYVVQGYVAKVKSANDKTYFMSSDATATYGDFQAYKCATIDKEVQQGDFVLVRGVITTYHGTGTNGEYYNYEISGGSLVHGEAPGIDTIKVNVANAITAGNALADNATTDGYYLVTGYVVNPTEMEEEDANQNFFLADEQNATYGDFKAYKAKIAYPGVAAGDKVAIFGRIKKNVYNNKTTIQIEYGDVTIIEKAPQGIENVVLTEKAKKVMVDGVVYIIRDNKMFDTLGNQVR